MGGRWQFFVAAYVAFKLGEQVQAVYDRHGAIAAIVALFFAMAFVEAVKGWVRWIAKR